MSPLANCLCPECHGPYIPRDPDPWEGRLNGYCTSCAERRCDAYGHEGESPFDIEPSLEDLFTALTQTGWIGVMRREEAWRVSYWQESGGSVQHFRAGSLRGALTAALTYAQEQK